MTIKLTWADFDKTIFITPKNIRKLMGFGISIGDDFEGLETNVAEQGMKINEQDDKIHDAELNITAVNQIASGNRARINILEDQVKDLQDRVAALERG